VRQGHRDGTRVRVAIVACLDVRDRVAGFEGHQGITDRDQLARHDTADREPLGVHDHDRRDDRAGLSHQQIEVEADQRCALSHRVADRDARAEPASAERHRVEADMDQDFSTLGRGERDRMAARQQRHHGAGAGGVETVAGRIDRDAVAQHPFREDGVGHVVDRRCPALHRRGQEDGGHGCVLDTRRDGLDPKKGRARERGGVSGQAVPPIHVPTGCRSRLSTTQSAARPTWSEPRSCDSRRKAAG